MRNKKQVIPMLLLGAFAFAVGTGNVKVQAAQGSETINKGVFIGEEDMSGKTADEARSAIEQQMDTLGSKTLTLKADDVTVSATAEELGFQWENTEVIEEALNLGKSGNVIKRYMDNKDLEHETKTYELDFVSDKNIIKSFIERECTEMNREAQDGSLTREDGYFEVVPGVVGLALDVEKSVQAVQNYMNEWSGESGTVTLVAEEVQPRGTEEELSLVQDALGTATTYYGSTAARNQNVQTGAEKLNGHLLYPGESFSVTEAVIPFDEENGYQPAPSYESGKVVDTYGGGICQVSTTLYNALLKSELEILERHNHTMTVSYVDPSKDAAIAEGLMDLQFSNNTDAPIYIAGYAYGGELTFTIYGHETRSAERSVSYVSETTSTTEPEGIKLYPKSDANVGYLSQIQSAHQGLNAVLWKDVTENGETTRTQVNSSTYQATPVSYEVGINSSDPNVVAAIQAAIAANDLGAVQSIIAGGVSAPQPETQQPSSESSTTPETQPTEAPETQPTEAPETQPTEPQKPEGGEQIIDPPEPDNIEDVQG